MQHKIILENEIYYYTPIELFHGRKYIDIVSSRENLLDFKRLLGLNNLEFGLIFGTLLGAIRENNFISHDEDVDVFILEENKDLLLSLLFKLRNIGFEVARYEKDFLTIIRNDDYIDVYFFKRSFFRKRRCLQYVLDIDFFESFESITFLGEEFHTLNNPIRFLEIFYGDDWAVPKVGSNAKGTSIRSKLKRKLRGVFRLN